ncbi:hypothetical protein C8Q79DRAFT_598057 [Trametes meyenii]|nr:hypothetical protein C8Q79DRAFT_598057 [Trametes meyenii]
MSTYGRPSIGLPSTPRARSFVAGPARQDIPPRPRSSASERPPPSSYAPPPLPTQARSIRPQRSLNTLPPAPSGSVRSCSLDRRAEPRHAPSRSDPPPPLPGLPTVRRIGRNPTVMRPNGATHTSARSVDHYAYRRNEDIMSDSASSSGRSSMSPTSLASSRTSLEEGDGDEKGDGKPEAGHGASLWNNLASVASVLTISVNKAWQTKVATYSGEETPVGGESRLTRAMKAYHIEKARDPADLPEWLFDERERGVRGGGQPDADRRSEGRTPRRGPPSSSELSRSMTPSRREDVPVPPAPARITRGPTLADRRAAVGSAASAGSEEHVTKSMARLRALRDAKRNAKVRFGEDSEDGGADGMPQPDAYAAPAPIPPPISMPVPVSRATPTRPAQRGMPAPLGASLGVRGRQPPTRAGLPSGVRPVRA